MHEGARNKGEKQQISNLFGSKMAPVVNFIIKQQVFLHCTPTHTTFSMTYPHTTSHFSLKIPDETPLRLTASQTDTTRGVMVSGIMGACDIAPSLHFVEPRLKINGEEWIKVMDEYIVPNCTALMEPGHIFLDPGQLAVARQQACL